MQEHLIAQAKQRSIAKKLALKCTSPEGNVTRQYFQTRTAFEDFVNRALAHGLIVEAITCAS